MVFRRRSLWLKLFLSGLGCAAAPVRAQDGEKVPTFKWIDGPATGLLGRVAEIKLSADHRFLEKRETKQFLEMLGNPTSGDELGVIMPTEGDWFVVFEYSDVGYVKDDDKDALDADAMLASIKEGTKQSNEQRKARGWPAMEITGWIQEPKYDTATNNLEWAIRGESEGSEIVNYNTRILGRGGVMEVALVAEPSQLTELLPQFKTLLGNYSFTEGNRYSEFRSGDKVAQYGLAALVTGGAAAVALKTGLLQKFWKLIVAAVIGVGVAIKKVFNRIAFGSSQ